jgi:hypothetical protein
MDRREVNREEWMLDVLAFCIAQAIVGEDGFVGGGEGVVVGEREWLLWCVDISPCACVCGRSDEPIPHAGPRGTLHQPGGQKKMTVPSQTPLEKNCGLRMQIVATCSSVAGLCHITQKGVGGMAEES